MPSLKETLVNKRYSFKDTFNEHMRKQGMWNQALSLLKDHVIM